MSSANYGDAHELLGLLEKGMNVRTSAGYLETSSSPLGTVSIPSKSDPIPTLYADTRNEAPHQPPHPVKTPDSTHCFLPMIPAIHST